MTVDTLAFGVFYLPMVGTAVFYRDPHMVWKLAAIASMMVIVGFFVPSIDENGVESGVNRTVSIVAILVTAGLLQYSRRTQEALTTQTLRAERGEQAKARLLTNLSRELTTPVNSIVAFAEIIQEGCREDQREFIAYIHDSGKHLLNTFRNMIDVTDVDRRALRLVHLDLRPLLEEAVRAALIEAARLRVSVAVASHDEAFPHVNADPWAVKRILQNLLSNAVKFSNPDDEVTVALAQEGHRVAVVVRDQGIGMAPEVLSRLGELFFQAAASASRKFEGMGAGLALSFQLASAMGGELLFHSVPGEGTVVTLKLPAAPSPAALPD